MGAVSDAVEDTIGGAIDIVGDAVDDVGDFVVEDVLEPVVETVEATVEKAMEDPVGTAVMVAAAASGQWWALPLASASVTVANGGSLEDGLKNAAIAYVGGEIAQGVSANLSPELTSEFGAQAGRSMANVAGNVAATAATGGDPLQALLNGGLNAGVSAAALEVPGFSDMTKTQQAAVTRAISAELQGRDASQGLINAAIGAGIDAAKKSDWEWNESSPTTTNELVDQTAPVAPATPVMPTQEQQVEAPVNPTEQDMNAFYESIGIDPSTLSNTPAQSSDPLDYLNFLQDNIDKIAEVSKTSGTGFGDDDIGQYTTDSLGNVFKQLDDGTMELYRAAEVNSDAYTTDSLGNIYKQLDDGTMSLYRNVDEPLSKEDMLLYRDLANRPTPKTTGDLVSQFLGAVGANAPKIAAGAAGLAGLDALSNEPGAFTFNNDPYASQNLDWNAQQALGPDQGIVFGQEQLAPEFTKNAARGGIMALASGGQIPSLGGYAAGGNPRLLKGPGDGMSDNIPATIAGKQPARLADGEFVVPADVVSHLGNGSTEAGANVLYQMMERVRKARTGNPKQGKQINPQKFVPRKGK